MALEDAINENTAAIKELSLIMANIKGTPAADPATADKPKKAADKAKDTDAGKLETKPAETATGQAGSTETETSGGAGAKSTEIDYTKDVVPIVTEVAKKFGRDGALAVMQQFDVSSAKDLDKSRWQELIDACKAKLEEE